VLSRRFRDDLLVQCAAPARPAQDYRFDVDAFLDDDSLHGIPGAGIRRAMAEGGDVECPACGRRYVLRLDAPRFRWHPERAGIGTGPDGSVVEELPTILAMPAVDRVRDPRRP
jgi:hypothetical protein